MILSLTITPTTKFQLPITNHFRHRLRQLFPPTVPQIDDQGVVITNHCYYNYQVEVGGYQNKLTRFLLSSQSHGLSCYLCRHFTQDRCLVGWVITMAIIVSEMYAAGYQSEMIRMIVWTTSGHFVQPSRSYVRRIGCQLSMSTLKLSTSHLETSPN